MNIAGLIVAFAVLYLIYLVVRTFVRALRRSLRARRWAKAPQRDVSGLAGVGAADFKREVIRTGGPWKPLLRRLVLRDDRLLPKPPRDPSDRTWPRPPKPKYLTEGEADRLFSASLRTGNRGVMDLAPDEAQLQRYGLPVWQREAGIAAALGLPRR